MRIEEINSRSVREIDNKELLNLHFRLHQLAGAFKDKSDKRQGLTWEDLVNAHAFIVSEMQRRNIEHNPHDALDEDTVLLSKSNVLDILEELEKEVVVVPNIVCLVGSSVRSNDPKDFDILIRADKEGNYYKVQAENIYLPLRNAFRELYKKVHIIDNPQGAHGDHIPIYDLVLRRKSAFSITAVKSNEVKVDLGCGATKPQGYIGIDKVEYPGVDIIADLEYGIPLPSNYADEIRAHHFLEHIADREFIMQEIYRVLKPGGIFVFEVPSTNSEGAFVPGHKSFWNKTVFYFWTQDDLLEGRPKFEIEELEEYEENGYKYVKGVLRKPLRIEVQSSDELKPIQIFSPPKPAMKLFFAQTEAFSIDELWGWLEKHKEVACEPKYNGFRAIIQKSGDKIQVFFEDAQENRNLPTLDTLLSKIDADYILDCDVGLEKNKKREPRINIMKLLANKITLDPDEKIIITIFDLPYWNEDIHNWEFKKRREKLEEVFDKYFKNLSSDKVEFRISDIMYCNSEDDIKKAWDKFGALYMSEGIVLKDIHSPYELSPSTNYWAKVKHVLEIKAQVIGIQRNKNNTYSYVGAILDENGELIPLGKSFSTKLKAKEGDIMTFQVQEIILQKGRVSWLGATPIDIDKERKTPYTLKQVIDLAQRAKVLQVANALGEEGEQRAEKAQKFWEENWYKILENANGRFVYQLHIRGIEEEDKDLSLEELLKKDKSVHGDLRLETLEGLWGFTIFEGDAKDLLERKNFSKLIDIKDDEALRGTFKLIQPKAWLRIGVEKPFLSTPGSVGATSKKYAKFFALDTGTYKIGFANRHFVEIFLDGKHLKGRYIIQAFPVNGDRVWVIEKPKDQKPFLQDRDVENLIKEYIAKGHKYLILGYPIRSKPEVIELKEVNKAYREEEFYVEIANIDDEERFVLAPFVVPNSVDKHGLVIRNPEKIERALHDFMLSGPYIMFNHRRPLTDVKVVEAYVLRSDTEINGKVYPKGTGMIGLKILNDELWNLIKSGIIKGVSYKGIVGIRRRPNGRIPRSD